METKFKYIKRNIAFLWSEYHFIIPPKKLKYYFKKFINRIFLNKSEDNNYYNIYNVENYNAWLTANKKNIKYKKFKYNPLISIVIPVYNAPIKVLKECIDSVLKQSYKNFEICIADDSSTDSQVINTLKEYEDNYSNIKVVYRTKNGHISLATNSAIEISKGEFIGLLDNDDLLDENALYEVVAALNENNKLDLIYSDEDKIDLKGRFCDPNFKPNWSPDTLLSHNYICHFTVIRKSVVESVGMFRKGYEGSQDYDLFLRVTEKTNNIYHIPKILYHWRMVEGSTSMTSNNKSYAVTSGINALKDALKRRKLSATISNIHTSYILNYKITGNPKVSIIIPTKDKINLLSNCVNSILNKTTYKNYEIIIVDNNSTKKETFDMFEKLTLTYSNVRIIHDNGDFNFSRLNNEAVKICKGDYVLLLNNDIEVINDNWLEIMLGYAQQNHIGAVGPMLLFKDKTIQHAGVVVGVGKEKIANHVHYMDEKFVPDIGGRLLVPYNYSAVTAACLLVSKDKYNEVNGLTEELAVNYNDIDFCLKLRDKGYYNVFLPQVELFHYESKSRGKTIKENQLLEFNKSCEYMIKIWGKYLKSDDFYNPNLSKEKPFKLDKK